MMLVYRSIKGSPLTVEEMDGNFKALADRLEVLETSSMEGEGIGSVEIDQGVLRLTGSKGSKLGEVKLTTLRWRPRGAWQPDVAYETMDLVFINDSLYLCQTSHTSDKAFAERYWDLVFESSSERTYSEVKTPIQQTQAASSAQILPMGKVDLPSSPAVGTLVLVVDSPEQPDLFYWQGEKWLRVRDGIPLNDL